MFDLVLCIALSLVMLIGAAILICILGIIWIFASVLISKPLDAVVTWLEAKVERM